MLTLILCLKVYKSILIPKLLLRKIGENKTELNSNACSVFKIVHMCPKIQFLKDVIFIKFYFTVCMIILLKVYRNNEYPLQTS